MKFVGKIILLISPEPWDHIFVSKHHYAVHLAKRGNKVFFLNPPGAQSSVSPTGFPNVFQINYKGFPPGLRFSPSAIQKMIMARVYQMLEVLCATRFDVVWSFDNSVFFNFSFLPAPILRISHIVDLNQDFETRRAASTAHLCFCTSDQIKQSLSRFNSHVYKINHGFNAAASLDTTASAEGQIKALYAGNLAIPYIDWPLLSQAVARYPDVRFVFIGPNGNFLPEDPAIAEAKNKVLQSANVELVGKVEFHELSGYYSAVDILLVAYQQEYHSNQVANPHKMMEYLGAGKVIVATKTLEYLDFHPLIVMSDTNAEWLIRFGETLSSLAFYNSELLQHRRRAFALENSYDAQINRIEQYACAF